ncbi:DUF4352 domain-containing protein [Streptomyces sp. NPDC057375]|uniref:DUF4352 domain-containing protein n=1 Tax=Streptomyces sp. NPDC057375 TaxID=3346109 RepID=UPI0036274BD8
MEGHTDGNKAYLVTLTVKNTGDDVFDGSFMVAKARANGKEVVEVNDDKHGLGHYGDSVAPGTSSEVEMVFDAPPSAHELDVTVTPDLLPDDATWKLDL